MHDQQQISELINKLNNDWKRTNYGDSGISKIDKDIMVSDLRMLYELVSDFPVQSSLRSNEPRVIEKQEEKIVMKDQFEIEKTIIVVDKPVTEEAKETPQMPSEEFSEDSNEEEPFEDFQTVQKSAPAQQQQIEFEIVNNQPVPEDLKSEEIQKKAIRQNEKSRSNLKRGNQISTSDKFHATKTLADVYQNNGDNSLAAKMQKHKISDIRSAIGINEKFLFINEIFRGEMSDYNQTIEKLNNCDQYHEALELMNEMRRNSNAENKQAFDKLGELIKRKFY